MSVTDSLLAEKAALERIEREKATHKRSARVFFDVLDALYPPQDTPEYWEKAADMVCKAYADAGKPKLLLGLLTATMEYLEDVAKDGQN